MKVKLYFAPTGLFIKLKNIQCDLLFAHGVLLFQALLV